MIVIKFKIKCKSVIGIWFLMSFDVDYNKFSFFRWFDILEFFNKVDKKFLGKLIGNFNLLFINLDEWMI